MIDIKMQVIKYDDFIKKYQKEIIKQPKVLTDLDSEVISKRLRECKKEEKLFDINYLQELEEDKDIIFINSLTIKSHDNKIFKIVPIVENKVSYKYNILSDNPQLFSYCLPVDNFLNLFTAVDLNMLLSNVAIVISTVASLITIINFLKEIYEKKIKESKNEINSKSKYLKFTLKIWKAGIMYEIKCMNSTIDEIEKLLDILNSCN